MSQFSAGIMSIRESIRQQELDLAASKRVVNKMCAQAGQPALYPEAELEAGAESVGIQRGDFYNLSLPIAIKKFLESRKASGRGPATVAEIIEALNAGTFNFGDKTDANIKTAVYVSLAKNSYQFHRLRGGRDETAAVYGLQAWFPNARNDEDAPKKSKGKGKAKKAKAAKSKSPSPEAESVPAAKPAPAKPAAAKPSAAQPAVKSAPTSGVKTVAPSNGVHKRADKGVSA